MKTEGCKMSCECKEFRNPKYNGINIMRKLALLAKTQRNNAHI